MKSWIFAFTVFLAASSVPSLSASDDCSKTAASMTYSNAYSDGYTGDVSGYELVVKRNDNSTVEAFLYVYEGSPSSEAIPLPGRLSGEKLSIKGDWVEHLIEYPSKKETVQTHAVEITGILNTASFRGEITIEGLGKKQRVRLKRVDSIWRCKK